MARRLFATAAAGSLLLLLVILYLWGTHNLSECFAYGNGNRAWCVCLEADTISFWHDPRPGLRGWQHTVIICSAGLTGDFDLRFNPAFRIAVPWWVWALIVATPAAIWAHRYGVPRWAARLMTVFFGYAPFWLPVDRSSTWWLIENGPHLTRERALWACAICLAAAITIRKLRPHFRHVRFTQVVAVIAGAPVVTLIALIRFANPVARARSLRAHRHARWLRHGLCPACHYDLRATPTPGGPLLPICPECGSAIAAAAAHAT